MPSEEYSRQSDYKFKVGPINVMTYLTTRASDPNGRSSDSNAVNSNSMMRMDADMYESFLINL